MTRTPMTVRTKTGQREQRGRCYKKKGAHGVCMSAYSNRIHILPYPTIPHDLSVSVDSHPFVVTVTDPFRLVIPPVRQLVPYPTSPL